MDSNIEVEREGELDFNLEVIEDITSENDSMIVRNLQVNPI
jgi:hypothetical protein